MVAVLAAAEEADADLARVLTAATGGDPELPGEQGTNDGQSLQDGQLTPEEMARLEENTNLTPEQQEALVRGDLVLPTSQMEYLNNLSRSLDGKSPAEIRSMIDQMNANGQNGGAVSDALQLLGNENITTAGERRGRCAHARRHAEPAVGYSRNVRASDARARRADTGHQRAGQPDNRDARHGEAVPRDRQLPRRRGDRVGGRRLAAAGHGDGRGAARQVGGDPARPPQPSPHPVGRQTSTCRRDSSTRRCRTCCPQPDATRWPCTAR